MVKTHIGVKWPNIELKPMTGTIAYEVMTKKQIPGPGVYDPPMIGGPHGGKFNGSKTLRLIDQIVFDARKLPGPGQYDGLYEPIDVPIAGYVPVHERSPARRRRIGMVATRSMPHDRLPLSPSCMTPKSPMTPKSVLSRKGSNFGLPTISSPMREGPRSKSVDPYDMMMSPGSKKGVTFGSQQKTQSQLTQTALEELVAQELMKANGQYTGNHATVAGVQHVDHRLATPKNRLKGPTMGGRPRRMSQVTIVSYPTTVTHGLFLGEQAGHGMHVRHEAQIMDEHGIPLSRENSPERGKWAGMSFSRTTRGEMEEMLTVSPIDGRVKNVNNGELARLVS